MSVINKNIFTQSLCAPKSNFNSSLHRVHTNSKTMASRDLICKAKSKEGKPNKTSILYPKLFSHVQTPQILLYPRATPAVFGYHFIITQIRHWFSSSLCCPWEIVYYHLATTSAILCPADHICTLAAGVLSDLSDNTICQKN